MTTLQYVQSKLSKLGKLFRPKKDEWAAEWQSDTLLPVTQSIPTGNKTSSLATIIAVLLVLSLLGTALAGFFATPAGQEQWERVKELVPTNMPVVGSALAGGDDPETDFSCPAGIDRLEFDEKGVLLEPYPKLQPDPVRYCFELEKYQTFLTLKGDVEDEGKPREEWREITGLDWLAETISYPDWAPMLDEVKAALQDIRLATNMASVGWIELPGYGYATPAPNPPANTLPGAPGQTEWEATPTAFAPATPTPTPEPTATAMPPLVLADIPTLVAVTPQPQVATAIPEEIRQDPTLQAKKADALTQTCANIVEATRFWKLDELPIWNQISYLEFRWGEDGLFAMSDHVGGNGPDAFKRLYCVRQVLDAPSKIIDFGEGITGEWNYAQARVKPLYGGGDGVTNGRECLMKGLWLFECSVEYPDKPTPTPVPPPTATPFAGYGSLGDYITVFWASNPQFYYAETCPGTWNGTSATMAIGNCFNGHMDTVNMADVWDLLDLSLGKVYVGDCGTPLLDDKSNMEYNSTDVCFGPVK